MKKSIIILAALTAWGLGFAQEKMKVELKDGNVATYNVEDISRFYFVTEEGKGLLAANCEVTLVDSLVLTDELTFRFDYESEVEHVKAKMFTPQAFNESTTDDQIYASLEDGNATILAKDKSILGWTELDEGTDYILVYAGYNAQGKRGNMHRIRLKTKMSANEAIAEVTSCKFNDKIFFYSIEIDDKKVFKYYAAKDIGNNLDILDNVAVFGLTWRNQIKAGNYSSEFYTNKDFTTERTNGETQLHIVTWAEDYQGNLYNRIYEGFFDVNRPDGVRIRNMSSARSIKGKAYDERKLSESIKQIDVKLLMKQ